MLYPLSYGSGTSAWTPAKSPTLQSPSSLRRGREAASGWPAKLKTLMVNLDHDRSKDCGRWWRQVGRIRLSRWSTRSSTSPVTRSPKGTALEFR